MKEKLSQLRALLMDAFILSDQIEKEAAQAPKEVLPMSVLKIDPDRLYSQGEAAGILGVASSTLALLSDKKKIETFRPSPTAYRKFKGSVLVEFMKKTSV